nr:Gfo/Idh/MocA family oxidoreductase [Bryobacter sp.]
LSDKGIDYVLIATPEHWHYQMAKDALEAGKHVYVEKPMTQYADQAKKLAAMAKTAKTKLQVGVQGMSDDSYAAANEHFKKGTLGKVVLAQIDYSRNHKGDFFEGGPDPDVKPGVNLDWNAFLGPAKKRPFDMDRFLYWRRYWDYSSGIASDLFIHRVTRLIKSLDLKFPTYGVGTGGKYCFTDSKAEIPDTQTFLIEYPEGLTVQLVSSMANETRVEHMLRGHKATLTFTPTGFVITPQSYYKGEVAPVEYKKTGAEAIDLHHRNLMAAIREGAPLRCDADLGYLGVVATQLGVVSFRERKYTRWDAQRGKIQKL